MGKIIYSTAGSLYNYKLIIDISFQYIVLELEKSAFYSSNIKQHNTDNIRKCFLNSKSAYYNDF